VKRVI